MRETQFNVAPSPMHYADAFASSAETLIPPPPPLPPFSRLLGTPYRTDPPRVRPSKDKGKSGDVRMRAVANG